MSVTNQPPKLPDTEDARLAHLSATELSRLLANSPRTQRARIHLDDTDLILPRQAISLLRDLLAEMAQGNAVTIVPTQAELTTQQAANILNVSRPHLVKLLEDGEIPFTKTGTHRRVRYQAIIDYKLLRDQESHEKLDELTAQAQEHGMGY
ncbi:MAG: helix-turn-helix domain-containing protein [Xanthomonadales bacterium]|nr:helix-turn-helix domain-containing protein [Xanthomonadales bacterium]